mmetsp:Transcript_1793/g.4815  ORF Transcript_1793/g.4815 Transcript_1793/m.4815 type:complete len:297 (+) Transcript_1793:182-1072(+)
MITESSMTAASNTLKSRVMGTSQAQPTMTENGTTKRAICVEEPMATPKARSILPLAAQVTAVACSAAFPTMGRSMTPMNALGRPYWSDTPSMESTRKSEQYATAQVAPSNTAVEAHTESKASSSPSSSPPPNMSAWVTSWNIRNMTYTRAMIIEQMREIQRTSSSPASGIKVKMVGNANAIAPKERQFTFAVAPPALKWLSLLTQPAAKNAMPKTNRRFERTEPIKLPWTTPTSLALIALTVTISSTALPKVALSSPPIICPVCTARHSVAWPRMPAKGTMAMKLKEKTAPELHSA